MRKPSFASLSLLALALAGCPESVPGTDGGPLPGTDAPGTDAPGTDAWTAPDAGPVESDTVNFGPDPLPVGAERTVCVVLDAGNDVARQVRAIRTHLPTGSHHMIVYRTDAPLNPTPVNCTPFAEGGSAIFIAETVDAYLQYPTEASLSFAAHQHIRVEVHEVNYTAAPIDIRASVTFEYYPTSEPAHMPVQFLFTGDMGLFLPPHMETTVTSFHGVPTGARVFGLTSHTHGLGIYASISRGTSETVYTELLHEAEDWANPSLDTFGPPLTFPGDEGLRLECTYNNTRDSAVSFGLGFEDEMCFLWAYYY